jgi:hypothetical protein
MKLYPKRKFDNKAWHKIRHRLAEAIKGWLAWCYFARQPWDVNFMAGMELAESRNHTDIIWHYQRQLDGSPPLNSDQRYKMEALLQFACHAIGKPRPMPEAHIKTFEEFVIEEKLLHLVAERQDPQLQNRSRTEMDQLAIGLGKQSALPQLALLSLLLELSPGEPLAGPSVRELHRMHLAAWKNMARDRNATILKIILQRGHRAFAETNDLNHLKAYHEVLDWGIELKLYPEYHTMDVNSLRRIVQQSLALGESKRARSYLKVLGELLFEEAKQECLPLFEAFVLMHEGAYNDALNLVRATEQIYDFWRTGLDMLLVELICRYELGSDEPEDLVVRLKSMMRRLQNYRTEHHQAWLVNIYIDIARALERLFMKKAARNIELLQGSVQNPMLQYVRRKRLNG